MQIQEQFPFLVTQTAEVQEVIFSLSLAVSLTIPSSSLEGEGLALSWEQGLTGAWQLLSEEVKPPHLLFGKLQLPDFLDYWRFHFNMLLFFFFTICTAISERSLSLLLQAQVVFPWSLVVLILASFRAMHNVVTGQFVQQ